MVFGSILLVTFFLPLYTYLKFKETQKITGQYIFILIGTMFFILFSILLALNVSVNVLDVFTNDGNNSAKITRYLESKNQKLYADFNAKSIEAKTKYETRVVAIQSKANKLSELLDSIKIELIAASDKADKKLAKERMLNTNQMANKTEVGVVNTLMIGEPNNGLASNLKLNLKEFQEILVSITNLSPELAAEIKKLLNTNDFPTDQGTQAWEQFTFGDNAAICAISVLTDIETRVRMAESQTIQFINTQN